MKIYRLKPAGMSHNGFFATIESAQEHADKVLESFLEDRRKSEPWEPDEWYPLATALEWEQRDVSEHPGLYNQPALAAQYTPASWGEYSHHHLFIIETIEVSP